MSSGDQNNYRYVQNNPVKSSDPSGLLSPSSVSACAVGFIAGGAYDAIQTVFAALKIIEDAEKKLAELAEEKKTCSSKRKDQIRIEETNLNKIVQYNTIAFPMCLVLLSLVLD